jgi:potassium-dependent mechanosensitive channel
VTRIAIIRIFSAACLLLCFLASAQAYDEVKLKDAERMATLLQAQLKSVASRVDGGSLQDDALASQRTTLEKLRTAAKVGAEKVGGPLNEIASQVAGLGAPPTDGQQEAETIAAQRKQLNAQLVRATAAEKQFVLIGLEADQALSRLTSLQRGQFLQRIFKADKSILNPSLWIGTFDGASIMQSRIGNLVTRGLNDAAGRTNFSGFLLLPIGLTVLGLLFFRLLPSLMTRVGFAAPTESDQVYSGLAKLWHVIWSYAKYFFFVTVFLLLFYAAIDVSGYLTLPIKNLLDRLLDSIEPALMYGGLLYFVTSPRNPALRLVAIDSAAAQSLVFIVIAGYLAYGFGEQISAFATSINLPVSFAVGQSALSAVLLIALIAIGLVIVRRQASKGLATEGSTYFLTWFMNFIPLWWVLLGVATIALLFGFIALSYFIAGNLLDTAILAVTMGVVHAFIDALSAAAIDPHSRTGHAIRRFTSWSDQGIQRVVLVLRTIADAILIVFGLFALIALWTVVLFDVAGFAGSLAQGLKIGNITLSPKAIAIAIAVLFVGITATKYFTRWLERRVLSETQLDKGVQDSLRAITGYSGYSLAGAFALTAAGLDFSSLALVFGALGVGIGLGLQSVTNNFVSGLILLAERPIRVGDWVVTNAGEGIVKKINVRSTEIETFDNCSIIVPNSNLINNAVSNWTHRDSVGRFYVGIIFNHRVDAKVIAEKLLLIAQNHPKVMRHPLPLVQLAKISPQGYEFDIRGHLRDVFDAAQVTSDIRMSIAHDFGVDVLSSSLPPAPNSEPETVKATKAKK